MDDAPSRLVLISGAAADGRAAVGATLARSLPRAVHVDGEAIAAFVVSGAVPARLPLSRDALEQLYLRWSAAIGVAETYQQAGFDVVISDNVVGELFADFVDFVSPAPLHVVILCAPITRDAVEESVAQVAQVAQTPRVGLWLDPSGMSVEVAVAQILDRLDEALVHTGTPPPSG